MKKSEIKKLIIACLATLSIILSLLAVCFAANKSFSATVSVNVPEGKEVSVYVSGNDVTKNEVGYTVPKNQTITVTVVNESALFESMTINDDEYKTPVVTLTAPDSGELKIEVKTSQPYAEDKGRYFGNPYILSREADVLAVARILADKGTAEDYQRLGETEQNAERIRYGYYRLGTNIFISDEEFFGLGFRGAYPFSGCFDFNGYAATINLVRVRHVDEEFTYENGGTEHIADYGFFAYAYGDGVKPCLIRNANVQGFIGINTLEKEGEIDHVDRVQAGGLAGTLGKNVVLDGIESSVSVGAQTRFASLYIGGVFGLCSSSVDAWCSAEYDGVYNDISGVTYGTNASVIAGCFAGVIQNASVNGVMIDGQHSLVVANALGAVSGSAIAGGFAGVINVCKPSFKEVSDARPVIIKNVSIIAESDYSVNAVINNSASTKKASIDPDDFGTTSAGAVAGGIAGTVNRDENITDDTITMVFANIVFQRSADREENAETRIEINASTKDYSSSGAVYAGGAIGFIYSDGSEYIGKDFVTSGETKDTAVMEYIFDCPVDVTAVQNGVGPAYAGGTFGYNCFNIGDEDARSVNLAIVAPEYDYTVTAVQSATSSSVNDEDGTNSIYNVSAGGYTSRLQIGYEASNIDFTIGNGRIIAYREVGSTAVGDITAGGFAGKGLSSFDAIGSLNGYEKNPVQKGSIENFNLYFTDNSYVEAACYSFSSIDNRSTTYLGNNVCAGGLIGYVLGFTSLNNINVEYVAATDSSGKSTPHFVYGAQNAKNFNNRDADLKSEGFVGGAFGLVADSIITDISITGDPKENSVVYFESANTPNTASVGGLIGALWTKKLAEKVLLSGAKINYIHVAGKAYSDRQTGNDTYDIYVGGAIGVFANPTPSPNVYRGTFIEHITVKNSVIESIGENKMLTYAGGIVAGMWWHSRTNLSYGIVQNCAVTASSITAKAYAGGITGLMQNSNINHTLVQNTDVKAVSETNIATTAGVASRVKDAYNVTNSYSNASLQSNGGAGSYKAGIHYASKSQVTTSEKNFFVSENAGTDKAYTALGTSDYAGEDCALHLVSYGVNKLTISTTEGKAQVYPALPTHNYPVPVWSNDEDILTVTSGSTTPYYAEAKAEGVAYVSAYCKIENVDYLLCSYPVTVVKSDESGDFSLAVKDEDGNDITEDNCDGTANVYDWTSETPVRYRYFRRNVGNPKTVKKFIAKPVGAEYFPQNVRFYDVTDVVWPTYDDDISERAYDILAAKPTAPVNLAVFNGRANVGYNYVNAGANRDARSEVYFYANDNTRENTIIIMECDFGGKTYGVIVEFVPNRLRSIEIAPDSGTPPLDSYMDGDGNMHYVYVEGDIVRFDETLTYHYTAPRSYVVETIYEGNNVTENGTLLIPSVGTYAVTCRDLKKTVSATVYIESVKEVNYTYSLLGANASFDRKMVSGSRFRFNVEPQPGYSLQPEISVTTNGETVVGAWNEDGITFEFASGTYVFDYDAEEATPYDYDVTVPADFVTFAGQNDGVFFEITYKKIYSLVFISNFNGNDFFTVVVAAGEKFASVKPDGFEAWKNELIAKRYGFDFRGFYPVSKAGDVSAYGKSFEEMQADGVTTVNGTMRFYARWTYNIVIEAPEEVSVSSSLSSSMLHDGTMIPLDDHNGFGFVMKTGEKWQGTPRFDAFIKNADGTFTSITSSFTPASQENGYFVSSEKIGEASGFIHIVIYADNLEFNVGDGVFYDGNSLYTDGIFTLTYSVNYGEHDKKGDVNFMFGTALPANTSLRLFYRKEGVTIWSGGYGLTSSQSVIPVSSFASMGDNSALSDEYRNGASSEQFILVVTLPNNSNGFGITEAAAVTASVNAYEYTEIKTAFGNVAAQATDKPNEGVPAAEKQFTLYPAVIRSVTNDGNSFTFSHTGEADENVVDHRHNGVYYMWRVEKTAGGYIGDALFDGFGKEVVRTTDAIYYSATEGAFTVIGDLTGYTVSLIETKNVQQPAQSLVLYTQKF